MYDTFEVGNYGRLLSLEAQYEQNGVGEVSSILDYLEGDDSEIEELPEKIDLLETLGHLKFYSDLSQAEIAGRLGISQMHVSRLQRSALEQLKLSLGDTRS